MPRPPVLLLVAVALGCGSPRIAPRSAPAPALKPVPADAPGLRVLFVGNSLTEGHDVPGLVRAVAAAGGVTVHTRSAILAGSSLEDHWTAGPARATLAEGRWDFVVLQQGPSSRPDSRANLREWAGRWAAEIRARGARPAVYMVWCVRGQPDGFGLVARSYREAADAAGAAVLPAGEAWRAVLAADPGLGLYSDDGLHATAAGSYLAALVIARGLTGVSPLAAPARLTLADGREVAVPEAVAATLRAAAAAVTDPPEVAPPPRPAGG